MNQILVTCLLMICLSIDGCGDSQETEVPRELLIYCGITMIRPMSDIAAIIEEQEDCKIIITKGGSGNLLKSLRANQVGDLYLPGSDSYIVTCLDEGLIAAESDTVFVGHNKAAMMVPKGNPKGITADLDNLTREDLYVVIGNPNSGSIGKETKKVLERKGIFEAVQQNARSLTTDSKDLFLTLKHEEADLVVNWFAVSTWPENEPYLDVLAIDERYAHKQRLVLGLLKTSKYPGIARKFMQYAASDEGKALFSKYGLYNVI